MPVRRALLLSTCLLLLPVWKSGVAALRPHKLLGSEISGQSERLEVITVATDAHNRQVAQLLDSCKDRFNVKVLGQGAKFQGMLTKLTLVMQHLRSLPPNQLILFLDQDVRCFPCSRRPAALFNKDHRHRIIFATDPDCYPDVFKAGLYPPSPSSAPEAYRFVNSGTYIGRAQDIQFFWVKHLLHQGLLTDNPSFSDQRLVGDIFLGQYYSLHQDDSPSVELDYSGHYFQVFDMRQTSCWKQDLATRQVRCDRMFEAEACLLHTPGHKAPFYDTFVPRWLANETNLY